MRLMSSLATAAAMAAVLTLGSISPSEAACRKMGFLVNDYGKDGPTKDAQSLLDKDIAKWAGEKGIAKYDVSKRDVTCELFLNFIVFDEHTCTASATVCWDEKAIGKPAATTAAVKDAKAAPTGTAAAAPEKAPAAAAEAKPAAEPAKAEAPKTEAPKTATAKVETKVETGTVAPKAASEPKPAAVAPVTGQPAAASPEKDASQAAAAAAERAAAAAERAAVAAERAAQAAQDAQSQSAGASAATTSAASDASGAVVKPITPTPAP